MQSMSIQELAGLLQKQQAEKFDFVAPAKTLRSEIVATSVTDPTPKLVIHAMDNPNFDAALSKLLGAANISRDGLGNSTRYSATSFTPTEIFKRQIGEKLGIPAKYFEKMETEAPDLLTTNINRWLSSDDASNYLVRTFISPGASIARAFLSDRYRPIDNIDVLFNVLESVAKSGAEVEVKDCKLSETSMYVKVIAPGISCDVKDFDGTLPDLGRGHRRPTPDEGAWITTGFIFRNSELGCGKFAISPLAFKLACTNFLIQKEQEIEQVHLGGKLVEGLIQWSEATRNKSLELLMAQTRDAIGTFLSPAFLGKVAAKVAKAEGIVLKNPTATIENVTKAFRLTEDQQANILDYFIKEKRNTLGAVSDAVTFYAHEQDDADLQVQLERIGDEILEMAELAG